MRWLLAFMGLMLVVLPTLAMAQTDEDKATARKLFFEARDAYEAKDYPKAVELFERSNEIFPAPTAALGLGRALVGMGKLVRAYETFMAIVNAGVPAGASEPFKQAVADAEKDRDALEPRLPSLVIKVRGPDKPVVTVDGHALPAAALGVKRFLDPGRHEVRASGTGYRERTEHVTLSEGDTREIELELSAAPAAKPQPRRAADPGMSGLRVAGIVIGSVGIASLIVTAITGGLYLSKKATVDEHCTEAPSGDFVCDDQAGPDAASAGRTLGIVNVVTLVGGILGVGLGVTLFVIGGNDETEVALRVGPSGAAMVGAF